MGWVVVLAAVGGAVGLVAAVLLAVRSGLAEGRLQGVAYSEAEEAAIARAKDLLAEP